MLEMRDIYYKVDSNIVKKGFWQKDIEGQKELIQQELKKYTASKIAEIDQSKSLPEASLEQIDIVELVEMLGTMIPKEKHFDTLRHFTHYILNVASNLQGYSIIWSCEENHELKNNPVINFDIDGKWNSLTTISTEDDDYVKIFAFVNDVFLNQFMTKKIQGQKIIIRQINENLSD